MGQLSPLRRTTVAAPIAAPAVPPAAKPAADTAAIRPLSRDTLAVSGLAAARPAVMNVQALDDRISRETGTTVTQGNRVQLHVEGGEAYPKLMETLKGAQKTLHLQMYIFHNDQASWDVAEALADRAAHGVKVRVSSDYVGTPTSDPIFEFLRANGVEVRHHVTEGWNSQVDHRKIVVADGKKAMTGGMNVANEYRDSWHDAMITLEGPIVHDIQREFLRGWKDFGGSPVAEDETVLSPEALKPAGKSPMRMVTTYPEQNYRKSLFAGIDAAQKQINMELPYFSDQELIDKLCAASKRGVKVNLVLAGKNDLAIMDVAARAHFQQLKSAGVNVLLYQGKVLHTKVTTVDGVWATIGSGNGDARSLRLHREMNVNISDADAVATIDKRIFEADYAASKPLGDVKEGLAKRVLNRVIKWVSPVL